MRRYYFTPQELTIMALAVESASEELLAAQMAEDENVAGARRRIEGYERTIAEHEAVLSKIRRYWDDESASVEPLRLDLGDVEVTAIIVWDEDPVSIETRSLMEE
jgi:hypothetical protein